MPNKSFLDFKAIKSAITIEQVLSHYGVLDAFKKSGDSLSGACPVHHGSNPTQFRVSVSKNIWNCFGDCKGGGNVLDLIAKREGITIHAAALKAVEWFRVDSASVSKANPSPGTNKTESAARAPAEKPASVPKGPNPTLKFRLEKLDPTDPYFELRKLTLEAVKEFGMGYCSKGLMAKRIAIPIHNRQGELVAYAGRAVTSADSNEAKYKLPPGFVKSLELFNAHRAFKESDDHPLVIVEGFFGCIALWDCGFRRVVALMGSSMSPEQEEMIRTSTTRNTRIVVMLDEDDAGRAAREEIALRLAKFCYVKIHRFETEGQQPDHLMLPELTVALA